MIPVDPRGYFITGSDTDVGKTYIACQLVAQLRGLGLILETRKPAESGCSLSADGELQSNDAAALQQANGNRESIERIAAFRFQAALAPHRAARLENKSIEMADLLVACRQDNDSHCLLVEGAGGFYSPLAENGLNADLASQLQLPVIIVVNDRIGAVNQALMTVQAVENRHLQIAAIILNQVSPPQHQQMDNFADLKSHCSYPVFCCGHKQPLSSLFEPANE